jgi:hypothetical protein
LERNFKMSKKPLEAALEVIAPALKAKDPREALIAAKCTGLLQGYAKRWDDTIYKIDDVESVLTADLINPESGRKSRSFIIGGKLDVRATEIATGARVIFDHKTTSDSIEDPASDYWSKLVVEGQPSHYFLLEWMNGEKIDKAIWNAIRRPGILPKEVPAKVAQEVRLTGKYFDYDLSEDEKGQFEVDQRETNAMYTARLARDCSVDRPDWYFQRKPVPRLEAEIHAHALDLWDHSQNILNMRANQRYPRISAACMLHNSACTYLGLCSGHDTQDSGKWQTKKWLHPELPIVGQGNGAEILTNSRVQTLICPQKHHLKYEVGLEKVDSEEREVIIFGNLFHEALEQFYLTMKNN